MKSLDFEIRDSNSNEKNMTMNRIRNHMFKTMINLKYFISGKILLDIGNSRYFH